MPQTVTVVIPVYNNEASLEETCREIQRVHDKDFKELGLEILFVNDGSRDGSWQTLTRLKERYPDAVTLINLSRNFGQAAAMMAGFNLAKGDAVICVSADLQDPIDLMGQMVTLWKAGTEIVLCHRSERTDGLLNKLLSRGAYAIARLSCPALPMGGTDYWLMSRRVCELLCSLKGRHISLNVSLLSFGFSKALIPYTRRARKHGRSGYTFFKRLKIVIDFVLDSSYLPIRFMAGVGALTALAGVIYSLLIVHAWFVHDTPYSGWAPLMIMVMVVGGTILLMLGIIAEYLWRIYDHTKNFPSFVVAEKIPADAAISSGTRK